MNEKIYEYDEIIHCIPEKGGAYVIFPWNIREEFGRGRFDLLYHRHHESHSRKDKQRGRRSCPCDYKRKRIVFNYYCIDTGLLRMIQ